MKQTAQYIASLAKKVEGVTTTVHEEGSPFDTVLTPATFPSYRYPFLISLSPPSPPSAHVDPSYRSPFSCPHHLSLHKLPFLYLHHFIAPILTPLYTPHYLSPMEIPVQSHNCDLTPLLFPHLGHVIILLI